VDARRRAVVVALALAIVPVTGCQSDSAPSPVTPVTPTAAAGALRVTSDAFGDGDPIPVGYTCDGANTSPPLRWRQVPPAAQALALVVADPDAPGGTFYHWVVTDIPTTTNGVREGSTPPGVVGANSAGDTAYMGPCPPSGTHHYRFYVFALSRRVGLGPGTDPRQAVDAINAAATAGGTLVGTYTRD
jgi:Raf kinase inhibitor-like YbhB/YbcL family protein